MVTQTKKAEKGKKATKKRPQEPESENVPEEEKQAKKIQKLEKNREASQLFRQRQSEHISELETKVGGLRHENDAHKLKLETLNMENKSIREQLTMLRSFIGQAVSFAYPFVDPATPKV